MEIPTADLAPIRDLYGRGLYIQAFRESERFGPMAEWSNTAARLLGGRLALQLGAARLGRWMHLRAYRDTPTHPEAIYYNARYRLERFGPVVAWRFLRSHPDQDWNDASPEVRADWYGLHAFVCGRLRDFDRAERWLAKAESMTTDRAWLCVERAAILEFSERYEDALLAARRSRELVLFFRPGVQAEAHILQILGRESEAIELLNAATGAIESGILVAQLAALQIDLKQYGDARNSYERYAQLSPLMDKETTKWLAARRADTAYFCGDFAAAASAAHLAKEPFYTAFAGRLEQAPSHSMPVSTRLEFPFVARIPPPRCALDLIPQYWNIQATPAPADAAPLDGMQDPRERDWATANGLYVCEATITPDAVFNLVERGIPFLLTFVDAGYSHSHLVVGADRIRHAIWMRDGTDQRVSEAPLSTIAERYTATGPRGLIVLPQAEASRLAGIELPDRQAYDHLHEMQIALATYQRDKAEAVLTKLAAAFPQHRITLLARLALARYDANPMLMLRAVDAMLAMFPNDATFSITRLNVLRDLGRKDERTNFARKQLQLPTAEPLFAHHYAQALLTDSTRFDEARRVMKRAVRQRPFAPAGHYILGNVLWEERRFQEATDLYRFAAAMEDRDEQFAEAYFRAARALDQIPEAMRFLKSRYERSKGKLAGPARAMFYALSEQDEMAAAFAALEAAWADKSNPTEAADAMLFAAEMRTNYNEPTLGAALLEQAKPLATRSSWLRSAARQALILGDLAIARRFWDELLVIEPLAPDVHRNLSRAIADLEGRQAAIAWTRDMCQRFPKHYPLLQLLIDWLRGEPIAVGEFPPAESVLREMIKTCPDDAWARRELALHLSNHGRPAEAFPELEEARRIEPDSPSYFFTLGHTLNRDDRPADARVAYETALRQSVDNEVAITELFALARGETEKRDVLQFIADEIRRQHTVGDGLLAFREQAAQAHDAIEPDDLLKILQEIFEDHSDVWQSWSMLIQQLTLCARVEEARTLAEEAVERHPLLARLWVDLADVCRALEDHEGQINALKQAVQVAPGWSFAARELAEALEDTDQSEEARVVLEQAVARSPLDPVNHGYLADNLWNSGDGIDGVARLRIALKMDPGYEWAWRHLGLWTEQMEMPEKALAIAKEICAVRPGDPRAWLAFARMLGPAANDEALAALDRVIGLTPRSLEAYDLKSERLAEMGRYDEAKLAATPAIFEADPPMMLQGRAAWVEARRGNMPLACREMKALVMLETTYYWGWQQLAEWYNEMGRADDFLEATEKLVELRPDNPIAIAMRGDARLQNDDREGGKEDLRESQQLEPGYPYPVMLLFDAHLQDEEYVQARGALAILEEHIADNGRPIVLARYAQLAARTNDEDGGVEAFRELVTLLYDSTWPIHTAMVEMRQAGWNAQVEEILQTTLETAPEFHPWILMPWLDSVAGHSMELEAKLKVVERVIKIHPRYPQAYDVMAEVLCRMDRFDDALAACKPEVWQDRQPLILRGRAAWIHSERGDRDQAIALMREVVTADPDYFWGWRQLAGWYDESESLGDYLEATEHLVRLEPNDPVAYGYRGEARAATGDLRGSRADFRRAFEIDPTFEYAGINLFDGLLAEGEREDAARILAKLEEHVSGPNVMARVVKLACVRSDREAAIEAFEKLALFEEAPHFVFSKAADAMVEAGYETDLERILAALTQSDKATPPIARLWVERATARGEWTVMDRLSELNLDSEANREALYAMVDSLALPAQRAKLHEFIQRFGDELKKTDRGWAKTLGALANIQDYELVATWGSDWKQRPSAESWMVHPLAASFRQLGRVAEANAIAVRQLESDVNDPTMAEFRVWMAFEAALEGKTDEAESLTEDVDDDDLDDVPRILLILTEGLIDVQREGRVKFEEARTEAKAIIQDYAPKEKDADLTRSYRRWALRLARDAGGISAWIWANWRGGKLPAA